MNSKFLNWKDIKVGSKWGRTDGSKDIVTIISVTEDDVFYKYDDGKIYDKDPWHFQVRYYPKKPVFRRDCERCAGSGGKNLSCPDCHGEGVTVNRGGL